MSSTPAPFRSPHDDYLGPWNLHRCDPRHPIIANISAQPAQLVRTTYRFPVDDVDRVALWGTVAPDEEFNLCLCDETEAAVDNIEITLAWFGTESPFEQSWSFNAANVRA